MFAKWLRKRFFTSAIRRQATRPLSRQVPQLLQLEDRVTPAITITDAANFVVTTDAADNLTIGVDSGTGKVTVNSALQTTLAANVTSLTLTGTGAFSNVFNVEAVVPAEFTSLTTVTIDAGGGSDQLFFPDFAQTVNITAANKGTSSAFATFDFDNVESLIGGSKDDTFTLPSTGSITAISGGGGTNTFKAGSGAANTAWDLTGANAGQLTAPSAVTFSNIQNITGEAASGNLLNLAGGSLTGQAQVFSITNTTSTSLNYQLTGANAGTVAGVLGSFSGVFTISGGSSSDSITGTGGNDTFALTGTGAGSVAGINFNTIASLVGGGGVDTLNGTGGNDTFALTAAGTGTVAGTGFSGISAIDGKGGDNTLVGPDLAANWSLTGAGSGAIAGILASFANINNITGGSKDDSFVFGAAAGSIAGNLDAGTGINKFDYINLATAVNVDLGAGTADRIGGTVSNINHLRGGSGDDTLTGSGTDNVFYASPGEDAFDGVGGANSLVGLNAATTWTVTGANAGNFVSGGKTSTFANIQSLLGGNNTDAFNLDAGASIKAISGGVGTNTITGTSAYNWQITGVAKGAIAGAVNTFSSITSIIGGAGTDTLTGTTGNDEFALTNIATGTGSIVGLLAFSGMDQLEGGTGSNTLSSSVAGSFTLTAAGKGAVGSLGFNAFGTLVAEGTSTLTGTAGNDTFALTATGKGTVASTSFEGFASLLGGGGSDTLVGTAGNDTFILTATGTGTVAGTSFSGMAKIDGGAGTNTLQGSAGNDTFTLTGPNAGTLIGTAFGSINAIVGGGGVDTLVGTSAADTFQITGAGAGTVQGITYSGISNIDGGGGSDTIAGLNAGMTFNITGADSGDIPGGIAAFSSIENLTGGTGPDDFVFGPAGSHGGTADGGTGTNTISFDAGAQSITTTPNSIQRGTGPATSYSNITEITITNVATGFTIQGSAGNDNLLLETKVGKPSYTLNTPTRVFFPAGLPLAFVGKAGLDTMTVKLASVEDLSTFASAITFDGTDKAGDLLVLRGSGQDVLLKLDTTTAGSGSATIGAGTLNFLNLSPVDVTGFLNATVNFGAATNIKADIAAGKDFGTNTKDAVLVTPSAGGPAFESAAFWNNTNLFIDSSSLANSVDVFTITATGIGAGVAHNNTNIEIKTGTDAGDLVQFNGDAFFAGSIKVNSESITTATGKTVDAGTLAIFQATKNITSNGTVDGDTGVLINSTTGSVVTTITNSGNGAIAIGAAKTIAVNGNTTAKGLVAIVSQPDTADDQTITLGNGVTVSSATDNVIISSADDLIATGATLISATAAGKSVQLSVDTGGFENTGGTAKLVGVDIQSANNATLTGGNFNDSFFLSQYTAKLDVFGGAGSDKVVLDGTVANQFAMVINEFVGATVGAGGLISFNSIDGLELVNTKVVTVNGDADPDDLTFRTETTAGPNFGRPFYQLKSNGLNPFGTVYVSSAPTTLTQFTFNGLGNTDIMRVTLATGETFASLAGAILFDGTDKAGDTLVLTGAGQNVRLTLDTVVTGKGTAKDASASVVSFQNLSPVDVTGFGTVSIDFTGANIKADVSAGVSFADAKAAILITPSLGGPVFEKVAVWKNSAVYLDTTKNVGLDVITVNGTGAAASHKNQNFTINTGFENGDTVTINGPVDVSRDFTVSGFDVVANEYTKTVGGKTIQVNDSITTGRDLYLNGANTTTTTAGKVLTVGRDATLIGAAGVVSAATITAANNVLLSSSLATVAITGPVAATNGSVTATGKTGVSNTSTVNAKTTVTFASANGSITNSGPVTAATGNITFTAGNPPAFTTGGSVTNSGKVTATAGNVLFEAKVDVTNSADVVAGKDIKFTANQLVLNNNVGTLTAGQDVIFNALTSVTNQGLGGKVSAGRDIVFTAGTDILNKADVSAKRNVQFTANGNVTIATGVNVTAGADAGSTSGNVLIAAGGNVTTNAANLLASKGTVQIAVDTDNVGGGTADLRNASIVTKAGNFATLTGNGNADIFLVDPGYASRVDVNGQGGVDTLSVTKTDVHVSTKAVFVPGSGKDFLTYASIELVRLADATTVTIAGDEQGPNTTDAIDKVTLSKAGADYVAVFNGQLIKAANLTKATVSLGALNDCLTIDISMLGTPVFTNGITYKGGTGTDAAVFTGSGVEDAVFTSKSGTASAGTLVITGGNQLFVEETEGLDLATLKSVTVTPSDAPALMTLAPGKDFCSNSQNTLNLSGTSGGNALTSLSVRNTGTLTVNGTTGDDTLTFDSTNNGHAVGKIVFSAGAGTDTLNYNAQGQDIIAGIDSLTTAGVPLQYISVENINVTNATGKLTVNGSNGDDILTIQRVAPNTGFQYQFTGFPAVKMDAIPQSFRFNGLVGKDTMIVRYVNGDPVSPGGAVFDGGADADVGLLIVGTGTQNVTYLSDPVGPGLAGNVTVDGKLIRFENLEAASQIDITKAAMLAITFGTTDDLVEVNTGFDKTAGGTKEALIVSGPGFAKLGVWNIPDVVIDTTTVDGKDKVTITNASNDHKVANLTVTTGAGADLVAITGPITLAGALTINTQNVALAGVQVKADGGATFNTTAGVTLTGGDAHIRTGASPILFTGTVDGPGGLQVFTTGATTFQKTVGATTPLALLGTNDGGTTTFQGGIVRTAGTQQYNGPVVFTTSTTFATVAGGSINFTETLTPAAAGLQLNLAAPNGNILISKDLVTPELASVTITDANDVTFGGALTTGALTQAAGSGTTTFTGPVLIRNDANLTTVNVAANSTFTANNLTANLKGNGAFTGPVNLTGDATIKAVNATFASSLKANNLTADLKGNGTFIGPVNLDGNATITAVDALFGNTLNAKNLTATLQGNGTFTGAVNLTGDAKVTAVNASFASSLDAKNLTATLTGNGTFAGPVTLAGDANIEAVNLTFNDTLNAVNLATKVSDTQTYNGVVTLGGDAKLMGANANVNQQFNAVNLTTNLSGSTIFNGPVTLSGAANLSGGNASFNNGFNVANSAITMNFTGTVDDGANATIVTPSIEFLGSASYVLDSKNNDVTSQDGGIFANMTGGSLTFRDANDLYVRFPANDFNTPAIRIADGDLTLIAGNRIDVRDTRASTDPDRFSTSIIDLGTGNAKLLPGTSFAPLTDEELVDQSADKSKFNQVAFIAEISAQSLVLGEPIDDTNKDTANRFRDRFQIRPSKTTPITVNGNDPTTADAERLPGDRLDGIFTGITIQNLTTNGSDGKFTFVGFAPLEYFSIETLGGQSFEAFAVQTGPTANNNQPSYAIRVIPIQAAGELGGASQILPGGLTGQGQISNPFVVSPELTNPFSPFGAPKVTLGDVNGDGTPDLIIANGPGEAPLITIVNGNGIIGKTIDFINIQASDLIAQFYAYDPSFIGGINVAAGDLDGDAGAEIIVGAMEGGGQNVRVFRIDMTTPDVYMRAKFLPFWTDHSSGVKTGSFFVFDENPNFRGGVSVAVGDVNGDGKNDLIVGAGVGGGPRVTVYDGNNTLNVLSNFFAYDPNFRGGVLVDGGLYDDDQVADIVTAPGRSGGPHIRVFLGQQNLNINQVMPVAADFFAFGPESSLISGESQPLLGVGSVAFGSSTQGVGSGNQRILVSTPRGRTVQMLIFDPQNTVQNPDGTLPPLADATTGGTGDLTETLGLDQGTQFRLFADPFLPISAGENKLFIGVDPDRLRDGGSIGGFATPAFSEDE